jgi:arylamine N-acetyltransferase
MVASRRGGYCFEHNALLRAGLIALGFDVTSLVARALEREQLEQCRVAMQGDTPFAIVIVAQQRIADTPRATRARIAI